jgi:hypothetical protein
MYVFSRAIAAVLEINTRKIGRQVIEVLVYAFFWVSYDSVFWFYIDIH